MKKRTIKVRLQDRAYSIFVGSGVWGHLPGWLKKADCGHDAVVISNSRILSLAGSSVVSLLSRACRSVRVLRVPDTEKSKDARFAISLIEKIAVEDRKKRIFLCALGGGVIGDLTGFIAAIYKRGIPYIQVPTTLLAQIDSSIGGKTAVDLAVGKNLIGAFYQPRAVFCDVNILQSLPLREIRAGLSESVKYALLGDPGLFIDLKQNAKKILKADPAVFLKIVSRCALIKARLVEQDELDKKGIRVRLNFGHTIGHAIEAASSYRISHGEAVGVGMVAACDLSMQYGLLKESEFMEILQLFHELGLSARVQGVDRARVLKSLDYDKKFTRGINRFVLLKGIGDTRVLENIPGTCIRRALDRIF